jgi:hypothetical protein
VFVGTYASDDVPAGFEDTHRVVVEAEPFHRTRLLNCVARVALERDDPEYLLFTDADIEVVDGGLFEAAVTSASRPDYVLDHTRALSPHLPLSREWLLGSLDDPESKSPGKRGTHLVRSELFFDLNGFDQRIVGWGPDDVNLYARYAETSDRVAYYDRAGIVHLDHPDELRSELNPDGISKLVSNVKNYKVHLEEYDLRGRSWADEFGYPEYSVHSARPDR